MSRCTGDAATARTPRWGGAIVSIAIVSIAIVSIAIVSIAIVSIAIQPIRPPPPPATYGTPPCH